MIYYMSLALIIFAGCSSFPPCKSKAGIDEKSLMNCKIAFPPEPGLPEMWECDAKTFDGRSIHLVGNLH